MSFLTSAPKQTTPSEGCNNKKGKRGVPPHKDEWIIFAQDVALRYKDVDFHREWSQSVFGDFIDFTDRHFG